MRYKLIILFLNFTIGFTICNAQKSNQTILHNFAKGGDISWLPQMEATGFKFYDTNGIAQDCFKILKDHGFNTIRLRTWVNPSDSKTSGHCSKDETVAMAVRAKKWGMRIMINFHYSDTWADPGKQNKPKAWQGHDFKTLLDDVYNYNERFKYWFDNAKKNNAKYDVIGLSYYPYWLKGSPDYTLSINDLGNNLNDMASRYGKEVMIVEVGGEANKPQNTYDMLIAVQQKVREVPNAKGLGVLYWEPQGASSWSKYNLSAWGDDGKPTKALRAFLK